MFQEFTDEEIYRKISQVLGYQLRPGWGDFFIGETLNQGSKVQELDEKLCKHSREHWLGLDCLQELCCFFSPRKWLYLIIWKSSLYSWIMQKSRATRGVSVLFAMIWMQFRLYIHVILVSYIRTTARVIYHNTQSPPPTIRRKWTTWQWARKKSLQSWKGTCRRQDEQSWLHIVRLIVI